MKKLLAALISAVLFAFLPAPMAAAAEIIVDGIPIRGAILTTYNRNGGSSKFGKPIEKETKLYVSSRNTYHQHFEKGTVYWDGSQGGKYWMNAGNMPNIGGVGNERDAMWRYGKDKVLFRSANLCDITTSGRRLLSALLHGGTIIDLRTSGTCREPNIAYVTETRISIPSHADYDKYVTGDYEKDQFEKVLKKIAYAPGNVLVHCTAGKDRTGWTIAMVMFATGSTKAEVYEEYKRTANAPVYRLDLGLKTIKAKFGDGSSTDGVYEYLTSSSGLNLSDADLDALKAKVG